MKITAAHRILAVAAICVAALVGLVVSEGAARKSGQEVLLPMEAIDPRALLGGHYVQLNLTRRLAPQDVCPPSEDTQGWVALSADGEAYRVAGGAATQESAHAIAPLVVRGSFNCSPPTPPNKDDAGAPGSIWLNLGVERFHINQTDAERIDRVLRAQRPGQETRAFAIVSIGADGRARLKGLLIDGERLELSWL